MSDRRYYVFCEQGCKYESMTKEQILTAIMQAVNNGTIGDIDAGFITTIQTVNGKSARFFVGTQSEYEMLSEEEKENLVKVITNDTTDESIEQAIERLQDETSNLEEFKILVLNGDIVVPKANESTYASKAPKKGENSDDEENGKAFLFENTNGIGIDSNKVKGYWRLHSFKDDEDGQYYAALTPSYAGKQMLGSDIKPIKRTYVKQLGTESKKVENAWIKNANIETAQITNLLDGDGNSIHERIDDAYSIYEALYSGTEKTINLFNSDDVAQTKNAFFEDGAGLYEMRIFADIEGRGMSNYYIGLVRIPTGVNVSTYVTASNGLNEYSLQFKRRIEDEKFSVKLWVDGEETLTDTIGTMDVCYRKIM